MRTGLRVFLATWVIALACVASRPHAAAPKPSASPAVRSSAATETGQSPAPAQSARSAPAVVADHAALLNQYCVTCHNQRLKTGGLALDAMDLSTIATDAEVWEKVIRKVRARMMPPPGMPRPEQPALDGLAAHLETTIDKAALAAPVLRGPTIHRLNRAEYGNAIRDLFALESTSRLFCRRMKRPTASTTTPTSSTSRRR